MPAWSKSQRRAAAIAKHKPSKLYKRNKAMLKMSKSELHKFAKTKESRLPHKKKKKKGKKKKGY